MEQDRQKVDPDTPVFDFDEAVGFIEERTGIEKNIIETVLETEEDYMRILGIIVDFTEEL